MLTIKILGPGCADCHRLEHLARTALDDLQREQPEVAAIIETVSDPASLAGYGVHTLPGLIINEKVVSTGRIPSEVEVTTWLADALQAACSSSTSRSSEPQPSG